MRTTRKKIAEHEEKHHVSLELKLNKVLGNQKILNNQLILILQNQTKLMTKQEFADAVNAASDQLQKALNEIVTAISASGNSSPEMDAALARLQTAATALDDLNPDAPAPPVPPVDPNA